MISLRRLQTISQKERKALVTGLLFISPWILGFLAFRIVPFVMSFYYSFTFYPVLQAPKWIGFQNFQNLAEDPRFLTSLYNTAYYAFFAVPLGTVAGILLAMLLNMKVRWLSVFRTIFYLPSLSMGVATFILWQKMYNPETGPINTFLTWLFDTGVANQLERLVGWWQNVPDYAFKPPEWLQDPNWAKPALIFMGVWGAIGSNTMLLYLAALSNVPGELYEAADVDGASRWQRFWSVTWPQLAPTTFFVVIMGCIGGLQGGFEQARVMTNGGPAESTTTLSYYLFLEAFESNEMGYGCAIAWVLFGMVFVLTMINWRFGSQMVNYE